MCEMLKTKIQEDHYVNIRNTKYEKLYLDINITILK